MRGLILILGTMLLMTLTTMAFAASLKNMDDIPYICRIKSQMGLSEETVYPQSTMYFDCTYGCEITLLKTDQSIKIESDKDIVIDNGELQIHE